MEGQTGEAAEIAEFLTRLDDFTPTIPDETMDYYLSRTGFQCSDPRIKRMVALAAQKFIADVATDAKRKHEQRMQNAPRKDKDKVGKPKVVLTTQDLASALEDHGVNIRKPRFYAGET